MTCCRCSDLPTAWMVFDYAAAEQSVMAISALLNTLETSGAMKTKPGDALVGVYLEDEVLAVRLIREAERLEPGDLHDPLGAGARTPLRGGLHRRSGPAGADSGLRPSGALDAKRLHDFVSGARAPTA